MEDFSKIHCSVWNFFENINGVLKQVRITLNRADVWHHCNKLLVCLNSKFDELKEFDQVSIEKKRRNFLQCLELFLKGEIDLKERKTQFMQNWCLVLL